MKKKLKILIETEALQKKKINKWKKINKDEFLCFDLILHKCILTKII